MVTIFEAKGGVGARDVAWGCSDGGDESDAEREEMDSGKHW